MSSNDALLRLMRTVRERLGEPTLKPVALRLVGPALAEAELREEIAARRLGGLPTIDAYDALRVLVAFMVRRWWRSLFDRSW